MDIKSAENSISESEDKRGTTNMTARRPPCPFFAIASNTEDFRERERERAALPSVDVFLQIISLVPIRSARPSLRPSVSAGVSNEVVIESAFFTTRTTERVSERASERMTCRERRTLKTSATNICGGRLGKEEAHS